MAFVFRIIVMAFVAAAMGQQAVPALSGERAGDEIVAVRAEKGEETKQGIPRFHGISGRSAGSRAISLHKIRIPPGGAAKAHIHKGYETAVYVVAGRVMTRYG